MLFNALDDEHAEAMRDGFIKKGTSTCHAQYFGGTIKARMECRTCKNVTFNTEHCLDLSLALDKGFVLEESIRAMNIRNSDCDNNDAINLIALIKAWNQPEILEGDNAFACHNCYRKRNVSARGEIEGLHS